MNSTTLIVVIIAFCVGAIVLLAMAKPIKILFGVLGNMLLGAGGIVVANALMAPMGVSLGINVLTLAFTGILGMPGFCALMLISIMC